MSNSNSINIKHNPSILPVELKLAASKSESNRALIINALAKQPGHLKNLSEARDTKTMQNLLNETDKTWDVMDAGTTMRFLTAYAAVNGFNKVLTGTPRMQQRPIKILVDALRKIGVDIQYLKNEGYPPHEILRFDAQKTDRIQVRGDVSSQYISALAMIAPMLPEGLTIELTGKIGSRPYIEMTLALMKQFGAKVQFVDNIIHISSGPYKTGTYEIESDWSGASYWFSFVSLAHEAQVKLLGLRQDSLQGDNAIIKIMDKLGVQANFDDKGVLLTKKPFNNVNELDFAHCPDLAQTVSVTLAAKGITATLTGIESLRIKETDRIAAIQNEIGKFGARLEDIGDEKWQLLPCDEIPGKLFINTYDDHRMAMAFAPLATLTDLEIENPNVVQKSYPGFWDDMKKAGFELAFK